FQSRGKRRRRQAVGGNQCPFPQTPRQRNSCAVDTRSPFLQCPTPVWPRLPAPPSDSVRTRKASYTDESSSSPRLVRPVHTRNQAGNRSSPRLWKIHGEKLS